MAGVLSYSLTLDSAGFTQAIRNAMTSTEGLDSRSRKTAGGIGSMISPMKGLVAAAVGLGGLGAAFAVLKGGLNLASDLEQTSVALRTMVGDADKANALLSEVKKIGASTPFEFPELADATRKLIAFGEEAGNIPATLRTVGDIASGVGMPISELSELYGKARTQGTLFAEDLNQLMGRGIPIMDELAKVTGKPVEEIKKLASEGKITFPLLQAAFQNLTSEGGKFFGMMETQAKTNKGLMSTLKDGFNEVLLLVSTPLNDALKPVLTGAIDLTKRIGIGMSASISLIRASIAQGRLGELMEQTIKTGLMAGANFGASAFMGLANLLGRGLLFQFKQVVTLFTGGFNEAIGNIFAGLSTAFVGLGALILSKVGSPFLDIVALFSSGLIKSLDILKEGIAKIPGLNKVFGLEGFKAEGFDSILAKQKQAFSKDSLGKGGEDLIRSGMEQAGRGAGQFLTKSLANAKDAFKGFEFEEITIFDVDGEKKKLGEIIGSIDPIALEDLRKAFDSGNLEDTSKAAEKAKLQIDDLAGAIKKVGEAKAASARAPGLLAAAGNALDANGLGPDGKPTRAMVRQLRRDLRPRNFINKERQAEADKKRQAAIDTINRIRGITPARALEAADRAARAADPRPGRGAAAADPQQKREERMLAAVESIEKLFDNLATA